MRIAAQIYTLREHLQTPADFDASMKKLAALGYAAAQVCAYGPGITIDHVATTCRANGLTVASRHTSVEDMEQVGRFVDDMGRLGCTLAAIGGFGWGQVTEDDWLAFIDRFNAAAAGLKPHGIRASYHNHSHEWHKLPSGNRPIDLLMKRFSADVCFELDTYWVAHAGGEPTAWIRRVAATGAGRMPTLHFKDFEAVPNGSKMTQVGEGNLEWSAIITAARQAGTQWAVVERDSGDMDPFESLARSLKHLKAMMGV